MLETDEEVKARLEKEKGVDVKDENPTADGDKDVQKKKDSSDTPLETDKKESIADEKDIKKDKETAVKEARDKKDSNKEKDITDKKDAVCDKKKDTSDQKENGSDSTDKENIADAKNATDKKVITDDKDGPGKDDAKDVEKTTIDKDTSSKKADVAKKASAEDEKIDEDMETDEKKEGETSQEEGVESEDIGDEESEEQEGTGEDTEEGDTEGEVKEGEGTSDKKEEEDVSNLQLAWEMLELSKIIFKRNNSRESKLKLADSFLNLGEVGMETEQYETAISDFKECLRLQLELLDADDRALAETYYQLGLACTFHALYDDAVDYYRKASSTIEARIANLKKVIEGMEGKGKEKADPDDPLVKAQKEVKDLEDIIPDIMAKIEDVLDEKRNAEQVKQLVKENLTSSMEQTSTTTTGFGQTDQATSQSGAVKDITHLVRKRKKVEDDVEDTLKKAKTQENGSAADQVNGTTEVNGKAAVNGQASKSEVSAS